jgi:hypothetical protein
VLLAVKVRHRGLGIAVPYFIFLVVLEHLLHLAVMVAVDGQLRLVARLLQIQVLAVAVAAVIPLRLQFRGAAVALAHTLKHISQAHLLHTVMQ